MRTCRQKTLRRAASVVAVVGLLFVARNYVSFCLMENSGVVKYHGEEERVALQGKILPLVEDDTNKDDDSQEEAEGKGEADPFEQTVFKKAHKIFASKRHKHYQATPTQPKKTRSDGLVEFINKKKLVGEMNTTSHVFPFMNIKDRCDQLNYEPLDILPKTSVVLTFHNSEYLENLLRTVRSILKRTPKELLEEIVLIADNVKKDELKTVLDKEIAAIDNSIVKLKRSQGPLGAIKARLWGVRVASGPIVVCLDSHMEVQERWLEPLVTEIVRNPETLVSPSIDWISYDETERKWTMKQGGSNWKTFFDWTLGFGWQDMSPFQYNSHQMKNGTAAFSSPMTIGVFGIAKKWFTEVGEFDDGMEGWGGENVDLSLRVWLFGGRVVNVPCSHVAHLEKPGFRSYRDHWVEKRQRNHKRIVEVWFDEFKKYFYNYCPGLKATDARNLTARFEIKKRAKHNFRWFMDNVYPELSMYDVNSLAYDGAINLAFPNRCLDKGGQSDVILYNCIKGNNIQQGIYLDMKGHLRYPAYRVNSIYNLQKGRYVVTLIGAITAHGSSTNTRWFHWRDGPLMDPVNKLCMEALSDSELTMSRCSFTKKSQRWRFNTYTKEYSQLLRGYSNIKYRDAYLYQLSKILHAYQHEQWLDIEKLVQNFTQVASRWPVNRTGINLEEILLL